MERQALQEFIEIYRSEPSLWKMKSSHYNNKAIKNAAYRRLQQKLREIHPGADLDMVKKKINALRTNFRKEQRKVEASRERSAQTGEPVYVPSLWYYELFHFIAEQENDLKSNDDNDVSIDVQDILRVNLDENVYYDGEESDENFDEDFQVSSPDSSKPAENGPHASQSITANNAMMVSEHHGYKRKRDMNYSASDSPWYHRQEPESDNPYNFHAAGPSIADEHEIFGRYVASKLKKMDKPMQMLSERLISEVLYLGQMGCLNRSSSITTHSKMKTEDSQMNDF